MSAALSSSAPPVKNSTASPPKYDWTCDTCGGEVVQRPDDTEAAIRRRLELYEVETEPLITWYLERDKLVQINGMVSPDAVTARFENALAWFEMRHD